MKKILALFLIFYSLVSATTVSAQKQIINIGNKQPFGVKAVDNPNASPGRLISNTLQIMFILGGLAVLFFIVWGAFDWITSGGDKEKVSAARRKITNALIGLVLLALAGFIVAFVGEIVGFNPLRTPPLPTLDQAPQPIQPTTP